MRSEEVADDRRYSVSRRSSRNGGYGGNQSLGELVAEDVCVLSSSKELSGEEGDGLGSLSPTRQLPMRRSRTFGELEKDPGFSSPSATSKLPTVTAFTPLTPLKWKSSTREEDLEQDGKIPEYSNQGRTGAEMPTNSNSESVKAHRKREKVQEQQQSMEPCSGPGVDGLTHSPDETSSIKGQQSMEQGNGGEVGLERKSSAGEDPSVMTIEFLRARLLSERASSKAARDRVVQLGKKVAELEHKLEHEIELRKKTEAAAEEALSKLKSAGSEEMTVITEVTSKAPGDPQDTAVGAETTSALPETQEASVGSESRSGLDEGEQELEQDVTSDEGLLRQCSNRDLNGGDNYSSTVNQHLAATDAKKVENAAERRAAMEERVRNMWNRISEEMIALAEDQNQEDLLREELFNWMEQVPAVLQDFVQKPRTTCQIEVSGQNKTSCGENLKIVMENVRMVVKHSAADAENPESISFKDQGSFDRGNMSTTGGQGGPTWHGELRLKAFKTDAETKKVSQLIEQYEAQESVQQAWEKNYYAQQKIDQSKVGNKETVIRGTAVICTSSDTGTPPSESSLDKLQNTEKEGPEYISCTVPIVDNNGETTSLPLKLGERECVNDVPINGSGKLDAPHLDALHVDSDMSKGNGPHDATYIDKEAMRGQKESGVVRSLDPAFVIPSQGMATRFSKAEDQGWVQRERELDDFYYPQAASSGAGFGSNVTYPERGAIRRKEVHRHEQDLGSRFSEDAYRNGQVDYRSMPPAWEMQGEDPGWVQQQLHEERGYSQAGYGGGHVRLEPSVGHHLRSSRREVLHMPEEVYGHHWRSQSDSYGWQGDEDHYRERYHFREAGFVQRQRTQPPAQGNQSLGAHYHSLTENVGGRTDFRKSEGEAPLSIGYPGWDAPKEETSAAQSSIDNSSSKVNDVLRALQIAKLNIQSPGSSKSFPARSHSTSNDHRYRGDSTPGFRSGYGVDSAVKYLRPQVEVEWHWKEQQRLSNSYHSNQGAPIVRMPSSANGSVYDSPGTQLIVRDTSDIVNSVTGPASLIVSGHSSYVDKMTVGRGIQFFFT